MSDLLSLLPVWLRILLGLLGLLLAPLVAGYLSAFGGWIFGKHTTWLEQRLPQLGSPDNWLPGALRYFGQLISYGLLTCFTVALVTSDSASPSEVVRQQLGMTEWVLLYNLEIKQPDILTWPPKGSKIERAMVAWDVEATREFVEYMEKTNQKEYNRIAFGTLRTLKDLKLIKWIRVGKDGKATAQLTRNGKEVLKPYLEEDT